MLNGILHPIKYILKLVLASPLQLKEEFFEDINKDMSAKNYLSNNHLVWCVGLPKSGTTLIENILNFLPYVQMNMSPIRKYSENKIDHPHGICDNMFKFAPSSKYSFLKTHTHFEERYLRVAEKYNSKIILSLRDLRHMMISNFFYIINNPKHVDHKSLILYEEKEGFKKSLLIQDKGTNQTALEYYYNWIKDWKMISKEKGHLILWFEEYEENPLNYISKIIEYLAFSEFDPYKIEKLLETNRQKSKNLRTNIMSPGRKLTTFNKKSKLRYKNFFDDELESYFMSHLPGPIDLVTWK